MAQAVSPRCRCQETFQDTDGALHGSRMHLETGADSSTHDPLERSAEGSTSGPPGDRLTQAPAAARGLLDRDGC